jgi:hypothetical protein
MTTLARLDLSHSSHPCVHCGKMIIMHALGGYCAPIPIFVRRDWRRYTPPTVQERAA